MPKSSTSQKVCWILTNARYFGFLPSSSLTLNKCMWDNTRQSLTIDSSIIVLFASIQTTQHDCVVEYMLIKYTMEFPSGRARWMRLVKWCTGGTNVPKWVILFYWSVWTLPVLPLCLPNLNDWFWQSRTFFVLQCSLRQSYYWKFR